MALHDPLAVDKGAIGAAGVDEQVAIVLHLNTGMQPRDDRVGDGHSARVRAAERRHILTQEDAIFGAVGAAVEQQAWRCTSHMTSKVKHMFKLRTNRKNTLKASSG